jgi:hypothetical protein
MLRAEGRNHTIPRGVIAFEHKGKSLGAQVGSRDSDYRVSLATFPNIAGLFIALSMNSVLMNNLGFPLPRSVP